MKRTVVGAVVTAVLLISIVISSGPASAGRLHPELDAHLRVLPPGDMLSVIVEMTVQADPAAAAATAPSRARAARRRALVDVLQDVATRHQGLVHAVLAREHAAGRVRRVAPLWIFNGFAVTATEPVIRALAAHADVWEVRPDSIIPPPAPVPSGTVSIAAASEWNIDKVRAPEVWSLGYTGVGSVVGSFDTGGGSNPSGSSVQVRGVLV